MSFDGTRCLHIMLSKDVATQNSLITANTCYTYMGGYHPLPRNNDSNILSSETCMFVPSSAFKRNAVLSSAEYLFEFGALCRHLQLGILHL